MRKKLNNSHGVAALIVILVIAVLIMLVLIMIPAVQQFQEARAEEIDSGNQQTAEDSAYMKAIADGPFEAVYDKYNKKWVPLGKSKNITPYGESAAHRGMVLYVEADDELNVHMTWVDPDAEDWQKKDD